MHKYGIEIYWIHELISNLRQQKLTSGSRDVVLRMIEFFGKEELMTLNMRIIDLRKDRRGEEKSVIDIVYTRKKRKRIAV